MIVAGLCSGGWLAFQAARDGLAVDAIVSVNPPLYLRDARRAVAGRGRALERYQQSMRRSVQVGEGLRGGASTYAVHAAGGERAGAAGRGRVSGVLGDTLPDGLARICA